MSKSVNLIKILSPIALAIALSACGGSGADFGSGSGSTVTDTPDTVDTTDDGVDNSSVQANAAFLDIQASSRQLFSSGANPVIISAVVKDAGNNIINNANVAFTVNNFGTLDDDISEGSLVTKKLTTGFGLEAKENRTLTIVAKSGDLTETLTVDVVGTTIEAQGPANVALNIPVEYLVKVADSDGNGLDRQIVSVTSKNNFTLESSSNFETDENGSLKISYTAQGFGADTLTFSALGATESIDVEVSSQDFQLDSSLDEINLKTDQAITLNWTVDGVAQSGKTISIRSTRGLLKKDGVQVSQVVTDMSGNASFTTSSDTAGNTVITAETEDGLTATLEKEFVATTPHYLYSAVSTSVISPLGKSSVITMVRDEEDNPVKNQRVIYVLKDTVGGNINNSVAVTNSYGRAEIDYTAGPLTSGLDGVVIESYLESNPALSQTVTLTVGGEALRLVVGIDGQVEVVDDVFYKVKVGVIVTDSAGAPVRSQKVDFTLIPTDYSKGYLVPTYRIVADEDDVFTGWSKTSQTSIRCPAEDLDNDGKIDDGEDLNNSGTLEPTNTATISGEGVTDDEGKLTVDLIYPKSQAWWSTLQLTATVKVGGSESVETVLTGLPVAASEVDDEVDSPVNLVSPYGVVLSCFSED